MGDLIHLDEAREAACSALLRFVEAQPLVERAVLVDDLYGRIHVAVWLSDPAATPPIGQELGALLRGAAGSYWSGDQWIVTPLTPAEERPLYEAAWIEGVSVDGAERVRLNDRHRNRTAWFLPTDRSSIAWARSDGPPIVAFHSFKGGVGRTTALASYAIARARRGHRVAVIDMDLDAPGVGRLLDSDGDGGTARWGVVDFLLEAARELPLTDYRHVCARENVTGTGAIDVFPAGSLDDAYLTKLARVDLDVQASTTGHPLLKLLRRIRQEGRPDVILIDGRAGLSPAAGLLLSGFAHLHVLFATTNPQSILGLERVVRHLGFEQARRGSEQHECIVVQAMVPDNTEVGGIAEADFAERVEDIFRRGYYARESDDEDRLWSLQDIESSLAPHVPVPIRYRERLAFFRQIEQVATDLVTERGYAELAERIDVRLSMPSEEVSDGRP
jgi:MinD-like ATPase involved in chromosome partitioning or flagellar assembly